MTRPRQIANTATMVSMDMSIGSEATVDALWEVIDERSAVLVELRTECSWAE